jgi:hypothetical protein
MPASFLPLKEAILSIAQPYDYQKGAADWEQAYDLFHRVDNRKTIGELFDIPLDQVRLQQAEAYAEPALRTTDLAEADLFRKIILARETEGTIRYDLQRDHVVHTVNNYLLGWYFLAHCEAFRREFAACCQRRHVAEDVNDYDSIVKQFGEVWVFVSLLHDIGYMFEGNFNDSDSLELEIFDELRKLEKWLRDEIYDEMGPTSSSHVEDVLSLAAVDRLMPQGKKLRTASEAKTYLRDPGALKSLADCVKKESEGKFACSLHDGFDGFEVWAEHYREFGQANMALRMESLSKSFDEILDAGHPKYEIKLLDHGVTGGLLLLKHSTFWFSIMFALKNVKISSADPKFHILKNVLEELNLEPYDKDKGPPYYATHWWTSVVWATAATAIHNVQQEPTTQGGHGPLKLSEDPLAYLGILVDILQEWDRHSIHRLRAIEAGRNPISNKQVEMGVDKASGKIHVRYTFQDPKKTSEVHKDLDKALHGWRDLVEVQDQVIA